MEGVKSFKFSRFAPLLEAILPLICRLTPPVCGLPVPRWAAGLSRADGTLDRLRAIPWVFASNQTRICLAAWYGAGTGLSTGDAHLQREMYERWPFFSSLVTTLQSSLAMVDLTIGSNYLMLANSG